METDVHTQQVSLCVDHKCRQHKSSSFPDFFFFFLVVQRGGRERYAEKRQLGEGGGVEGAESTSINFRTYSGA